MYVSFYTFCFIFFLLWFSSVFCCFFLYFNLPTKKYCFIYIMTYSATTKKKSIKMCITHIQFFSWCHTFSSTMIFGNRIFFIFWNKNINPLQCKIRRCLASKTYKIITGNSSSSGRTLKAVIACKCGNYTVFVTLF